MSPRLAGGLGVFGNSLGAIVGVHLAVRAPEVRSLVASGCPTRVSDFAASGFRRVLLAGMRAIATAVPIRISVNHFIPYRRILRDPCIIDQVRRDPLVADARRFTPSTYADMLGWNTLGVIGKVKVPLLVLYAEHDGLQGPDQSILLFDAAQCEKEIRGLATGHVPICSLRSCSQLHGRMVAFDPRLVEHRRASRTAASRVSRSISAITCPATTRSPASTCNPWMMPLT